MHKDQEEDLRYPLTVVLFREGRPKYWTWHCPYCMAPVCELDGTVIQVRDISNDTSGGTNAAVRIRCPGTSKKFCRLWFEIQLYN